MEVQEGPVNLADPVSATKKHLRDLYDPAALIVSAVNRGDKRCLPIGCHRRAMAPPPPQRGRQVLMRTDAPLWASLEPQKVREQLISVGTLDCHCGTRP